MKAVIIGANGLVGRALLTKLLADSDFTQVMAISRKEIKNDHPKLKQIIISSIDEINLVEDQIVGDIFYCCLGTTIKSAGTQENFRKVDQLAVIEFAKIAKHKNAEALIVVSAQGANAHSKIFYNRVKGEVIESLKELALKRLVIMKPALLIGERMETRVLEKLFIGVFKVLSPVLPEKTSKMIGTDIFSLSERMIELSKKNSDKILIVESKNI